jgi:6-phosphogluconolactonase
MGVVANYKPHIEISSDAESLALKIATVFVDEARQARSSRGKFYVAVSGGYTPKRFFELLGELPESVDLEWEEIELFWVDERVVDPQSEWSNYKLAADTFLKRVPIPITNVHRIPTENSDVKAAAREYEKTIREVFRLGEDQLPEFDLILLGMGADGHTGSMFANSYASFDTDDIACAVYVLDEKLNRITVTHPVLLAARHLAVLVSGEEKADILKMVLTSEMDEVQYPIHILWPILDKVTWLVDSQAARFL